MASTIAFYTGDGTTTDFTVPFDYLAKKFVRVSLGSRVLQGGDYGDTSKDYYFLDKTTVRLKVPPQAGEVLTIRRYTSATDRVVSFKDASVLKATDLDVSSVQTIHIAEEGRDIINDALIKDKKGNWDAKGNRITNVGTPVDDSDAMTYGIYKADALGFLQSKLDVEKARDRAVEAETNSKKSEENSKRSEINAKASEDIAVSASEHADAVMVENQAIIQESREIIAENRVLHKETKDNTAITVARADEAVLSAKNAKNSELNAKKSEEAVTSVANVIVPIAPEIKIVADNIDNVVTDSNSIDKINIVGTDLSGTLSDSLFEDYGDLGDTGTPLPTITGGNIKIVADNIESVRTVAGLAPDFEIAIESVNTVNSLTIRAENASNSAEASANIATAKADIATAKADIATAKASEAESASDSAHASAVQADTSAKNSANSASSATAQATASANSAKAAKLSEDNAAIHKDSASSSAAMAKSYEVEAKKQADLARSYADQASTGQLQSDWNQTDSTQKDYIKNKPNLGAYATTKALTDGLAGKANSAHTHAIADVSGLQSALDGKQAKGDYATATALSDGLAGKANKAHTHAVGDVTGLQDALDGKLSVATFEGFVDYGDLGTP